MPRSYIEAKGRGTELKPQNGEDTEKSVKDIMKSITNVRNDRAKKEQVKKFIPQKNRVTFPPQAKRAPNS